jgi:N-acetylglucosaminyldiphosphoundecaprenol N-acetyl-beta-D-mannosaminyltransferase
VPSRMSVTTGGGYGMLCRVGPLEAQFSPAVPPRRKEVTVIPETVVIEGVGISNLRLRDLLKAVRGYIADGRTRLIMYANIHTMNLAHSADPMRSALAGADLVYCDGSGVLLGARILGKRIRQRLTAADFIYDLCAMFQRRRHSLFILAAEPGVAETAAGKLRTKYPRLSILGTHHGYFARDGAQNDAVISAINTLRPDCLFVGLGSPAQEIWAAQNRGKLNVPVIWCVGAVFDFVSGKVRRSPAWMRTMHLEWLFRLFIEPVRMFSRYVIGNPAFLLRMLLLRLRGGHTGR